MPMSLASRVDRPVLLHDDMAIVHDAPFSPGARRARLWLPLGCLLGGLGSAQAQTRPDSPVIIGGTGSGLAPMQRTAEMLKAEVRFVPNLGSGGGIKALMAGALDMALVARGLTDAERAAGLEDRILFRTPYVWAVQHAVPLQRATLSELAALYAGRVERWPNGENVRLVLRPESDGDTQFMRGVHPELAQALALAAKRPGMRIAMTDDDAVADIERIAGALGLTTLAMVHAQGRQVRVLELDGVVPGTGTLWDGRYRHAKTVHLITRATQSAAVQSTLRLLWGAKARDLMLQLGCMPTTAA
jgi:phosphate transport system substrate-binding protein